MTQLRVLVWTIMHGDDLYPHHTRLISTMNRFIVGGTESMCTPFKNQCAENSFSAMWFFLRRPSCLIRRCLGILRSHLLSLSLSCLFCQLLPNVLVNLLADCTIGAPFQVASIAIHAKSKLKHFFCRTTAAAKLEKGLSRNYILRRGNDAIVMHRSHRHLWIIEVEFRQVFGRQISFVIDLERDDINGRLLLWLPLKHIFHSEGQLTKSLHSHKLQAHRFPNLKALKATNTPNGTS